MDHIITWQTRWAGSWLDTGARQGSPVIRWFCSLQCFLIVHVQLFPILSKMTNKFSNSIWSVEIHLWLLYSTFFFLQTEKRGSGTELEWGYFLIGELLKENQFVFARRDSVNQEMGQWINEANLEISETKIWFLLFPISLLCQICKGTASNLARMLVRTLPLDGGAAGTRRKGSTITTTKPNNVLGSEACKKIVQLNDKWDVACILLSYSKGLPTGNGNSQQQCKIAYGRLP